MSAKERRRKSVFDRVGLSQVTLVEASEILGLSYRHCRRSYRRFQQEGDGGLVHRRRGQPSNRGKPAAMKQAVLKRYEQRYLSFGPTYAAEKLVKDGYEVDHETLRRWLLAEGLWKKRRKSKQHRCRRERKAHFGELVQMDGSHHRWFGEDRPEACLMNMVDDAQGTTGPLLAEEETTEAAMCCLWQWVNRYGIPKALYTDKKNVFITDREPTVEEELAAQEPLTAFGKACQKLEIEIIAANSPQAKGRVERNHGVYQDRLVKELALRGIKTISTANKLLSNGFVQELNAKFERAPSSTVDFHRPVPKGLDLADVFCFEEDRQIQNDWTIRYNNHHYQILQDNKPLPRPKDKVTVRTRLDGSLHLVWRGARLRFQPAPRPRPLKAADATPTAATPTSAPRSSKPAPNHPWRQGCVLMRAETEQERNT